MWLELLIVCGFIIIMVLRRTSSKESRFPPGPFAWPVLGHLHLLLNLPHQALAEYGHIVGLRLGQQRAVVVSSPELAKQVLATHDKLFADRPPLAFTSALLYGSTLGLIFSRYGPVWRKHRKICTLHLFTAKRLQELQYVRQQEIHNLLLSIHHRSCAGTTAVDLGECVGQMSSHILMRLVQSRSSLQLGDENFYQFMKGLEQEAVPVIGDFIPALSWLDYFQKRHMRHLHARIDRIYTEMLMKRKESASFHDDLVHALLTHEEALTTVEIKSVLSEIVGAGINTTALTLEWAMAELLRNPRCFNRLQREIDTLLGEIKEVSEGDLPNLTYLKCVIKEALRLHPVAPLLLPHFSTEECELQGYTIPAKTLLFVNVWAIGRDERVWPNANAFMPERFEGKEKEGMDVKGQHFELLPFGAGRRSLPFALLVIEVTLANLVSCFDWELPQGETHTSVNMDEKGALTIKKATPVIAIPKPRASLAELQQNVSRMALHST